MSADPPTASAQLIVVTGSADGLGLAAAAELVARGHRVLGHARNARRAEELRSRLPGLAEVLVGDAASFAELRALAADAAAIGRLDAVIHNVAIGYREPAAKYTADGHLHLLQINVLAPYLLTTLLRPRRLVWMSSGLHRRGRASLDDLEWRRRPWDGWQAYADSKLFDTALAFGFARLWPQTPSNAVDPAWVPTRMGGPDATGDRSLAHQTQAWLAEGADEAAGWTGRLFFHGEPIDAEPVAHDESFQDALLEACAALTGARSG